MSSRRMLTSFIIFLWCGTPVLAQLPKRLEGCLSNLMLGQEVSEMQPLSKSVFVRIAEFDFGANGSIPEGLQREIKARLQRQKYQEDPEADYLRSAGDEMARDATMVLKERGYFGATAKATVTNLEKVGREATSAASISAELGPEYRLGALLVKPKDPDFALAFKTQPLHEEFRLQTNEILNAGEIRNGLSRLTKIYCEYGFIDITAEPDFKIDDAKKTIDVAILVDGGRQYYVKDVQFWGVGPKLEARLRSTLPGGSWLFNSRVLENFFKENRSVLPAYTSAEDHVEFHRNAKDPTVTLLFDFRPSSRSSN